MIKPVYGTLLQNDDCEIKAHVKGKVDFRHQTSRHSVQGNYCSIDLKNKQSIPNNLITPTGDQN